MCEDFFTVPEIGALKGRPYGIFQHFCRKTSKKLKGDPLESLKFSPKSLAMPKKLKGGQFGF